MKTKHEFEMGVAVIGLALIIFLMAVFTSLSGVPL